MMYRQRALVTALLAVVALSGCGTASPTVPAAPYDAVLAKGPLAAKLHVPQRTAPPGGDLTVDATVNNRSATETISVQLDCAPVWVDLYDAGGRLVPRPRPMCMTRPVPFAPGESRSLHGSVRLEEAGSYSIVIRVAGLQSDRIPVQAR